ncbi:TNP1/EN/SPM transposase [Carex littledalei]|uniref:TNP1/EN/SPM transposase n=1 Tax=Carex littledalei TaxID=544730 RepID=A0A833RLI1_9POAL|nr:TNP1/EN/SPM transposase [Carex littledalei]
MHTPSKRTARQQTYSNEDSHDESADNTQKSPAKRGYTKMRKIAKMADGKQLDINVNGYNQFNCQDATTFANYLGTLVWNGEEVPLIYMNWKDVPKYKKNRLWDLVKDQVMKSFGKKLREFRHSLKKKHYDTHDNYDARIADRDERVLPDHWKFLIGVWDSDEWQRKMTHMCDDQPDLEHRNIKDGDLYSEIFGKEKSGRVRGLGLGPAPTDIWGDRAKTHKMVVEAREAQQKAEEDKRKMEEEREEERKEIRAMRAQMADMKAQLDKLANEKHGDPPQNNHHTVPVTDKGEACKRERPVGKQVDRQEKHGDAHQNNRPHVPRTDKGEVDRRKKHRDAHQNNHPRVPVTDKREDLARYRLCSIVRKCVVAEGFIVMDNPDFTIGGQKLGTQYVEVYVDKVIDPDEPLIRPYGTYEVMHQVDGKYIAWPKSLVGMSK